MNQKLLNSFITFIHRQCHHQQRIAKALIAKNFMWIIGYHIEAKDKNKIRTVSLLVFLDYSYWSKFCH